MQGMLPGVTADGNNHISLFSYDASGNATGDSTFTYAWDGESQLKSANGVNYLYDGDGRRVSKSNGKLYWYGPSGEIVTETDAAGHELNDYIFFGGRHIGTQSHSGVGAFYVEDSLGSSRVLTTTVGVVCYDADFTPYGGEQAYTNPCTQNVYKFERKERDTETGNDDFGARYYNNRFGRWLSADWSAVPVAVPYANLANPQTLNLYSMVSDDPGSFADLDGHCWEWAQHLCNLLNYGHWVDDDHLQGAIKKDAERARADIARTKNTMINGKSPSDYAASLTDEQAILARKALVNFFAHMVASSLFSACGDANYKCGIVFPIDIPNDDTFNWSAYFETEGEARALARTKIGSNPVEISPGKWRSRDGKWQYRAKPDDLEKNHVHLEELDPNTGVVIQNLHLRWPGSPSP